MIEWLTDLEGGTGRRPPFCRKAATDVPYPLVYETLSVHYSITSHPREMPRRRLFYSRMPSWSEPTASPQPFSRIKAFRVSKTLAYLRKHRVKE